MAKTLTRRGWPRPIIGGWPIPWVSPPADLSNEDHDRHAEVIADVLCQVCGEGHQPDDTIYLVINDPTPPGADVGFAWAVAIDDAIMHERCLRLAAGRCPALKRLRAEGRLSVVSCPASAVAARTFEDGEEAGGPRLVADGDYCTVLDTEAFLTRRTVTPRNESPGRLPL